MHNSISHSLKWDRLDYYSCLFCIAVNLVLSVSPHLATLSRFGTLDYLADNDDICYLAVSRAPYYGENVFRDPFMGWWENVPCLYPWLLFVPLAKLTHFLGLPLILASLIWRIVGGCSMGFAVFYLFRRLFACTKHPTAWTLGCTLVCLADGGFVYGKMIVPYTVSFLKHIWYGTTPGFFAWDLLQLRVVTPMLNLPFLLLLVASLLPDKQKGHRDTFLGAFSLGMCFLLNFYYWTAAVLGLIIYLCALLLWAWYDPGRRGPVLSQARVVALVLACGIAMGAPQVYSNWQTFSDPQNKDIMERMQKPVILQSYDQYSYAYIYRITAYIYLIVGWLGIFVFRLPGLGLLWCLTFASFALLNTAFFTRIEFENIHWLYMYGPMAEILVLGTLGKLLDRWSGVREVCVLDTSGDVLYRWPVCPSWLRAAWLVPGALVIVAALWRPYEALHAPSAALNSRTIQELRPLRTSLAALSRDYALAGPRSADRVYWRATNVAILYSQSPYIYFYPYMWSLSYVPVDVLHQRHALNGWLQGMDLATYSEAAEEEVIYSLHNPKWSPQVVRRARVEVFKRLLEETDFAAELLDRFRPGYLLLPTTAPPPERAGPWHLVQKSPRWALWARGPAYRLLVGKIMPPP